MSAYLKPTIARMPVGAAAYTLPWGMWFDADRRCWLHPRYPAEPIARGTVQMRVERRDDGYHVWPPAEQNVEISPASPYLSSLETKYVPVAWTHWNFEPEVLL